MGISNAVNLGILDWPWSVLHAIAGLAIGIATTLLIKKRLLFRLTVGLILILAWEIFELLLRVIQNQAPSIAQILQHAIPAGFFASETIANIVGDILVGSLAMLSAVWVVSYLSPQSRNTNNSGQARLDSNS